MCASKRLLDSKQQFYTHTQCLRYIWCIYTRYSVVLMQVVSDTRATKSLKRQRNHQKHPFPNPKNHGGGNCKKYAKGISGGARAGLPAQAARLTHSSAGTGFARKCKIAPFWEKNGNCRPLGRFFLWRHVAPASCSSGGNEIWSASKLAHFLFLVGIADTLRVVVK